MPWNMICSVKELEPMIIQHSPIKIFVLDNIKETSDTGLIITKDSYACKDYEYDLFLKLTGLDIGNKSYGLYSYVFDCTTNHEVVKDFVSSSDVYSCLDLLFLRGDKSIVGEDPAKQYLQIIKSLSAYLIDSNGISAFIENPITVNDIENWFTSLEIECNLDAQDICSLDDVRILNDPYHDIHIALDRFDITVDNYNSLYVSIDDISYLLNSMKVFDKEAREYLTAESAPSKTLEWPVMITLSNMGGTDHLSYSQVLDDKECVSVTLNNVTYATMAHELAHGYAGDVPVEKNWMNEGFAQYFAYIKFISPELRYSFYESLVSDTSDEETLEYYLKQNNLPQSAEDVDIKTCMYAYILQYWNGNEDMAQRGMFSAPIYSVNGTKERFDGDELSYNEAMCFIAYLIDKYTFKVTWDCMVENQSYTEVFGFPYKKLKADWIESVSNP